MRGIILLFVIIFSSQVFSQTIAPTDGGVVGFSTVAPGWTIASPSPDIVDPDGPGGFAGPYICPVPLPPTGHADWMSGVIGLAFPTESASTVITDLDPGCTYTLSCYVGNFHGTGGFWGGAAVTLDGTIDLILDGVVVSSTVFTGSTCEWKLATFTFTAAAPTANFTQHATSDGGTFMWWHLSVDASAIAKACTDLTTSVSSTEICIGDELTLTGTSTTGGTVTWDGGAPNGTPFTPGAPGVITYTATSTSATDCPFSVDVTINDLPTVNAGADIAICEGSTADITLSGTGDVGSTYTWDGGVTDGLPFAPPIATTTYTVTGTDINGCVNTDDVIVSVNPLPAVDAGADFEVCDGDMVTLTGTGAGIGGTYLWTGGVTDGVAFTPTTTTTYTVTGTDVNGCINTDDITVTVNDIPIIDAGPDLEVCIDGLVTLTGTGAGLGGTYVWTDGVIDGVAFDPPATTTYTITGTDANGCTNTDDVTITESDLLPIDAGLDIAVCAGETVTLTGTGAGIGGTYDWDGGITDGVAFVPAATTTYTVTGTDVDGCTNTDDVIVTVNPLPAIDAGDDFAICDGDMATIAGTGAGIGGTYTWTGGFTDGIPFIPIATATYTVTGTDVNGCINTDDIIVTVNPLPTIDAGLDVMACAGESVTLAGSGAGIGGTYAWTSGVVDGIAFTPALGTTTYTVTGTDVNGCTNTDLIDVVVNPLPEPTFIGDELAACENLQVRFDNLTVIPGEACVWDFGDGTTGIGCDFISHNYTSAGLFDVTLTVETAEGCSASVTFEDYISIAPKPNAEFTFLPNPVSIEDTEVSFTNLSSEAFTYEWDFGDGSSTSSEFEPVHDYPAVPNVSYNVQLIVRTSEACADTAVRIIEIQDILLFYIPNVFTPDGDDFNETFQPIITAGVDIFDYHLTIFNRYGEILFESFNPAVGWDGTYGNDGKVQDGVYIWQIEFGDTRSDEKHKQRGHVTLLD